MYNGGMCAIIVNLPSQAKACESSINADLPESQMGPPSPPCDDQRPLSPRGYSPINPKTVLGVRVD